MPSSQQSRNVLAIAGGGVWGLASLMILRRIMQELRYSIDRNLVLFPWQIFDIICGTSTGGLIAIMLGRFRMSIDDATKHFRSLYTQIFRCPRFFGEIRYMAFGTPIYDGSILKAYIKGLAAQLDVTKHEEALMYEENSDGVYCRTFVTAIKRDLKNDPPELLRSYTPDNAYTIWECARATTAIEGIFEPIEIQADTASPITYLDSNLAADNPSSVALEETENLFPNEPISCLLSIGPGLVDLIDSKGKPFDLSYPYKNLLKNHKASKVSPKLEPQDPKPPCFRFHGDNGLEGVKFDAWWDEKRLCSRTIGYMDRFDQKMRVTGCVKALRPKAESIKKLFM